MASMHLHRFCGHKKQTVSKQDLEIDSPSLKWCHPFLSFNIYNPLNSLNGSEIVAKKQARLAQLVT